MLATQPAGVMWIMSSSGRQTGFFYNLWSDPSGPWRKVKALRANITETLFVP